LSSERPKYVDEITLRDLTKMSASLILWLRIHIVRLLVIWIISIGGMILYQNQKPQLYIGELSFIFNDQNNPQISGASGILSQLGLPTSTGRYNVNKLIRISIDRSLIERTLQVKTQVDGKSDYLANHFIDIYELNKKWNKVNRDWGAFKFSDDPSSWDSDIGRVYRKDLSTLIGGTNNDRSNALLSADYGQSDYIMQFALRSPSEELSSEFVNHHYDIVSRYYLEKSTVNNQNLYDLSKTTSDSLKKEITQLSKEIATIRDQSTGSFRNRDGVQADLKEVQLRTLLTESEEVTKYLLRAEYALQTSTPLIELLRRSEPPLNIQKPSLPKALIYGLIIGGLLYLLYLFSIEVFRHLQNPKTTA
jgi:hypothetical protein